MTEKRLEGRRVLVTQAADYMGPAIAELFREHGALVIEDETDLREEGAVERVVEDAGRIDVLLANLAAPANFVENPAYFPPAFQETDAFKEMLAQNVPLGRLATPREDALFALFLASRESDFFVGQAIPFTGGWTQ
jgi:NAD(P)-dependent dehydrogenase (short-subunit alcohol dehydrogenase family)